MLAGGLAALNCWIHTVGNVYFLGGIQMPFGAIFVLLLLALPLNCLLRFLPWRARALSRIFPVLSRTELLTVYAMTIFGALISTPGCDNQFMTVAPTLFYFSTRENGWADLFYKYVPSWMAPGWNGQTYQREVIGPLFMGGLSFSQIPWHAWAVMLLAWTIFLLLTYAVLFFVALMFRRQWLEHEALAFPLVQLPLQMVDAEPTSSGAHQRAQGPAFWANRSMWAGFTLALCVHFFKGMNAHFPDWPYMPVNSFGGIWMQFTERPWAAMPAASAKLYLGLIGIAYLVTREISLSFWVFFLLLLLEFPLAEMLGYPILGFAKQGLMGHPSFIVFQSVGGWAMMAVTLAWTAREHLLELWRTALKPSRRDGRVEADEIFSARFIVFGFLTALAGLVAWCSFAGISLFYAVIFLGIWLVTSLVLARLVIEGGFLFPQASYFPVEWMSSGMFGAAAIGAANLTKLSLLQPVMLVDTRTNVLPAFLHTMRIAAELRMDRLSQRRLLLSVLAAIVMTLGVTYVTTLIALYSKGGLASYTFFTFEGPRGTLNSTAALIHAKPPFEPLNAFWMLFGAAVVLLLMLGRSRYTWFPFHPLGYLAAPTYPVTQMWFSFFLGWLIKSLLMRFGGSDAVTKARPFMIGLILGNAVAMMIWMIIGFHSGVQLPYWPG